jgi:hypothetical protein
MNLTALKTYAPQARKDFIQAMKDRAAFYGITEKKTEPIIEKGTIAVISGREFPRSVAAKRTALEKRINEDGFHQTMEALAYTWFNRFVAIRYMELHGYLDHGYRVLSHPEGKSMPEILEHAEHIDLPGIDKNTIIDLKLAGHKESELYRLLLIAQCNALHSSMPFLFERIDDETELLLPDNLLSSDSLIRSLVTNLDAEDCESVEVLGWLYQFYISEKKDTVMARKSAVPTEDIPAVTQLFTPHWIVRYLVENSLGRLWLLNRPGSRLREHMPYYIEGEAETDFLIINKPEEIKLLDPACGSGHMLTYSFDLLNLIYEEEGYAPTEIPALILRHNLHGLEICPRAAQLAELALIFKAREKSRRFFQPEHLVRPHIIELRDVRFAENELRDYFKIIGIASDSQLTNLLHQFEEAKNFGSLIQPCLDERAIANVRQAIEGKDLGGQLFLRETHLKVLRVLEQAEALTQRNQVVVANPPYMGGKQVNSSLKVMTRQSFPNSKTDLFAMFIERTLGLTLPRGHGALITMQSWMFLSSFQELRASVLNTETLVTMAHLGPRAFDSIGGEVVQTTAFVFQHLPEHARKGTFLRLTEGRSESEKTRLLTEITATESHPDLFHCSSDDFKGMPGVPIAYWASEALRSAYTGKPALHSVATPRAGMITGNNAIFVRLPHEVSFDKIELNCASREDARRSGKRWFPYQKGGSFRKHYGNYEHVVDWEDDGKRLRTTTNAAGHVPAHAFNEEYIFGPNVNWSAVSSSDFSCRITLGGCLFDAGGSAAFPARATDVYLLAGFLNSRVACELIRAVNPTVNFQAWEIGNLPLASLPAEQEQRVIGIGEQARSLARADWDNFETSWDFRDQPLLRPGLKGATLEASWRNWEAQSTAAIRRMQELETENNRLFINAYGLAGELQPEVPEDQITLARADQRKDIAAFLSYAVGCMMGRYSPDYPGLILANAGDTLREFPKKVGKHIAELTFAPDEDGIIPVLNQDWGIADDATARTVEFIKVLWPKEYLEENLFFISQSLGATPKEPSRDVIRNYFSTSFYKDHLQKYKKRPIYWLFSSGKLRAFQCLVYLHRYNEGTLSRMRTEYVIPIQSRIVGRIEQLEGDKLKATSTSHRKKLQKEQDDLKKQQEELKSFEEKLKHAAERKIKLDLDDGVKVNYAKFTDNKYGEILAEVKAICGTKDED